MAKKSNWTDDYWLYVMQLYMRKPTGVKPLYSKAAVDLGIEIHVHPREIRARQQQIEAISTPRIERIWDEYADNPRKLARAVRLLRSMKGFGSADEFYEGVEVTESFERDFRPIGDTDITPVILILVLDLYFRLTPITMVPETPEVAELARLVKLPSTTIANLLHLFRQQDPMFTSLTSHSTPLTPHLKSIWHRYGNGDTEVLAQLARELRQYYLV
ncbi:MAG: hypothetical protein ACI3YZ_05055 [Prevotella sp.]